MALAVLSGGAHPRFQRDLFCANHRSFNRLERGDHAQDHFALYGNRRSSGSKALFLTYEMAEGVTFRRQGRSA